ncbi:MULTISPECIES: hypothetical protein [unclassified Bradyrhizobium]|uniref:hypothetical protein n=1 Tax=unclassified Bradyrhizobium TaxID=2631580 RepID=UPI002304EE10|nr:MULTISPECIES: hypothetical protein [unclassified Bradyrhizobium]
MTQLGWKAFQDLTIPNLCGDFCRCSHLNSPYAEQLHISASTDRRIERALVQLSYFIERNGDFWLPLYEKFEAELQELKAGEDTKTRARRRLLAYSEAGALKAIR